MTKSQALALWMELKPNQDPLPRMKKIKYQAAGSKYGTCGIRIDGTPEFIDAVLSNLKTLIFGECESTRLELSRSEVKPVEIQGKRKTFENSAHKAEVCYIRLHERGPEAQMCNAFLSAMTGGR